ncbi:MAG: GTPase Era [Candidatus Electronema sp. V4]|uniref:GTPase Era n=1 Tax=Candidatus Electronema sp. V4 TaxID=3454756 RepID=UPI0040556844
MNPTETHHSGVVAVIGPPNAGKSTLLNRCLEQKIAIVTPLPQTTRNRIQGILTGENWQMLLLDTPGLHKAKETINKEMVRIAMEALDEADVVLLLADASDGRREKRREEYLAWLERVRCPVILALNKTDLVSREQQLPLIEWHSALHPFAAVVPICALSGEGVQVLLRELVSRLPEGPQYYPADMPTDSTERFIAAELIREKIFLRTQQEVPYSTAVLIDAFQEDVEKGQAVIHATILVERDSQKGILIGKNGAMLGSIRKSATKEIEEMLGCKAQLRLFVKVRKGWTENAQILRELGM